MPGVTALMRRMARGPARFARRSLLPRLLPAARDVSRPNGNIRVVGLLSSASGLGQSARLCIESLSQTGRDVSTADVASLYSSNDHMAYPAAENRGHSADGFSIYHLNPPMLLPGIIHAGLPRYYQSFNVGYWAWELETLPSDWVAALPFVQAVMVPSTFCRATIERYTSKQVIVVPHPVPPAPILPLIRSANQPFTVVSVFHFGSSFGRKNPLALVQAFRQAFADDPTARLILKTSDGHRYPTDKARLLQAAASSDNIDVIDDIWERSKVQHLIRTADLYGSLHRSEGFGLPLAEAMMLGTPVLTTNWSGNTDFCNPDQTYLVDGPLVPFQDSHPDYEGLIGARWAEPSVKHAAAQLKQARADGDVARTKALAARESLIAYLSDHTYEQALETLGAPPVALPSKPDRDALEVVRGAQVRPSRAHV